MYWFVLRDFKKYNAKHPAYLVLPEYGIEIFTPMHWVVSDRKGRTTREYRPVMQNLIFAHSIREVLDPVIAEIDHLQYQYARGGGQGTPMVVPDADMARFIDAVRSDDNPIYFSPEELTSDMIGKRVEITGGPLHGYQGVLLKMRGTRKRRIIVQLEGYIVAAIEVNPDFLRLL